MLKSSMIMMNQSTSKHRVLERSIILTIAPDQRLCISSLSMEVYLIEYCSYCYHTMYVSLYSSIIWMILSIIVYCLVFLCVCDIPSRLYLSISDIYMNILSYDDLYDIFSISVIMILRFHDI